jgi:hypothetical protein
MTSWLSAEVQSVKVFLWELIGSRHLWLPKKSGGVNYIVMSSTPGGFTESHLKIQQFISVLVITGLSYIIECCLTSNTL